MLMDGSDVFSAYGPNLKCKCLDAKKTDETGRRRKHNIDWVITLERDGLANKTQEKRILVKTTRDGEKVYIQYPGKESINDNEYYRPWDFKPKIVRTDGSESLNYSFEDIWDNFELLKECPKDSVRILATLYYRMAFMCDHSESGRDFETVYGSESEDGSFNPRTTSEETLGDFLWIYDPNLDLVSDLSDCFPRMWDMSLEAFLHFIDLLTLNEDCKYYYRSTIVNGTDWKQGIGKVSTLKTFIKILGWVTDDIRLSSLLMAFTHGQMAKANKDDIETITGGLVTPLHYSCFERNEELSDTME
jgi:hypothetical protein